MRKSNHMAQKQKYYLVMTLCLGWIIFLIFFSWVCVNLPVQLLA